MIAYRVESIPSDGTAASKLFAFAKDLGVQTIVTTSHALVTFRSR